jgi:galactokinase
MNRVPTEPLMMPQTLRGRVRDEFRRRFGADPEFLARAPGRVNLIGDHTDYNDGFVLPMAIDRDVWLAARARDDRQVMIRSLDFAEDATFSLEDEERAAPPAAHAPQPWVEFLRGVAWSLEQSGLPTRGWEGVVAGEVPIGAGLSSSAALELAVARAFAAVGGLVWQPAAMARVAQRAENEWVGVNCGIMDQLISAAGVDGHALLIDCRSLETRQVPIPTAAAVVVLDTGTRRGLVDSAYNERRAQCEAAARLFGVRALRDIDEETFSKREKELDPSTRKRARHVVTENARTLRAAELLERGDLTGVGELMDRSHASLRDDFEVSRSELDTMVELAQRDDACFGARMTGAGFGGCAVALVRRDRASAFARSVAAAYTVAVGLPAAAYVCEATAGASVEKPNDKTLVPGP